jgi:signal transduction histidine kinase
MGDLEKSFSLGDKNFTSSFNALGVVGGMDSKNEFRFAWQPYIVSLILVSTAAALRLWPLQAIGVRLAWLTFYPAVMTAALYGGLYVGLAATSLSCLTVLYILPMVTAQPFIRDSADWLGMIVFFATSTMISGVAEAMRRARAQATQAKEQFETANKELKEANKELEAANNELEAFSYSVSHDLRAPLRAIDGFSRILIEDYAPQFDPEALRKLQLVRDNTGQMGNLVDDLLAFSRLGRQELKTQSVKTIALVRQTLGELRAETNGRQVEFEIAEKIPECRADPSLLKLVWINLLANALKYTRQRNLARIEIGWKRGNDEQVFFVKDNGVGFDMKYAHKLFGVFQRLHRSEEYEGTGVGLAIVQRIVHRHGGRVWAEGQVDGGATFYFSLPIVESNAPPKLKENADELADHTQELV